MSPTLFLALAFVAFLATLGWRSVRRMRRLGGQLTNLRSALTTAVRKRKEAAELFTEALREAGYAPRSHASLQEATDGVAAAQDAGLQELALADEQLKQALLQAYRALPREQLREVSEAHAELVRAEEELDLARSQYNEVAHYHNSMLNRFSYRLLSPWIEGSPAEYYLVPGEEKAFIRRYSARRP